MTAQRFACTAKHATAWLVEQLGAHQRFVVRVATGFNGAFFAFFAWNALHRRAPLAIALGMLSAALLASSITMLINEERRRYRALEAAVRDLLADRRREEPSHARKKRP